MIMYDNVKCSSKDKMRVGNVIVFTSPCWSLRAAFLYACLFRAASRRKSQASDVSLRDHKPSASALHSAPLSYHFVVPSATI